MKVTIPNEVFAHVLSVVSRVIRTNINIPILRNVLLDFDKNHLNMVATDLETQISIKLELKSPETQKITVHSTTFTQYLNSLPKDGSLQLTLTQKKLQVAYKNSKASFTIKPATDYPLFETNKPQKLVSLPVEQLSQALEKTIIATSKDDLRPILTGVHFAIKDKNTELVALDTYRVTYTKIKTKANNSAQITVPAQSLSQLLRILNDSFLQALADTDTVDISLLTNDKEGQLLVFTYGPITLTTRLLEGEYPNYKDILQTETDKQFKIPYKELQEALKRVGVFAQNSMGQKVVFDFNDNKLVLSAQALEMGETNETINIESLTSNKELKIGFQLRFLQDMLTVFDSQENLIIGSNNSTSPAVIMTEDKKDLYHIIMPLKL